MPDDAPQLLPPEELSRRRVSLHQARAQAAGMPRRPGTEIFGQTWHLVTGTSEEERAAHPTDRIGGLQAETRKRASGRDVLSQSRAHPRNGWLERRPLKRPKSESVVTSSHPCSIASAAWYASATSFPLAATAMQSREKIVQ